MLLFLFSAGSVRYRIIYFVHFFFIAHHTLKDKFEYYAFPVALRDRSDSKKKTRMLKWKTPHFSSQRTKKGGKLVARKRKKRSGSFYFFLILCCSYAVSLLWTIRFRRTKCRYLHSSIRIIRTQALLLFRLYTHTSILHKCSTDGRQNRPLLLNVRQTWTKCSVYGIDEDFDKIYNMDWIPLRVGT